MNIRQLEEALDRYGSNADRWPAALQQEARLLLENNTEAAEILARAVRLDLALAESVQPQKVDAAFIGRIVMATEGRAATSSPLRPTPRFAAWTCAAMMLFLSAGYVTGLAVPAETAGESVLAGLMFGDSGLNLDIETDTDLGSLL